MGQFRKAPPMFNNDRTEPVIDDTAPLTGKAASRSLVPISPFVERRLRRRWYRWAPNPIFVTHLIAEAEQVPQARRIRRASFADAQAAYQPSQTPMQATGSRTRQLA
jgi:hypothetical protein